MSSADLDQLAQARFDLLVGLFAGRPGVAGPDGERRRFGSDALKVNGSIFAMLRGDRLVVKLPAPRVAVLIDTGAAEPFDAGKGKPMKEWVAVGSDREDTWGTLAEEALTFVGRG